MSENVLRIGVVGSRGFSRLDMVANYVRDIAKAHTGVVIVSGGAKGVDETAETTAKTIGLSVISIHADWEKHGRAAGPIRNSLIVEQVHGLAAFWDGKSKGTMDTVAKAIKKGLPTELYKVGSEKQVFNFRGVA